MIDRIALTCALVVVICTLAMARLWLFHKPGHAEEIEVPEPEEPRIHNAAIEATAEAVQEYAVSGKPKRVPFRERKKELREAARTRRRKMEEWREDD